MEVEGLYEDALALLDELGVEQCHWIGASVGGFIGVRLAARHPERIASLVLIGFSTRQLSTSDLLATATTRWPSTRRPCCIASSKEVSAASGSWSASASPRA